MSSGKDYRFGRRQKTPEEHRRFEEHWESHGAVFLKSLPRERLVDLADRVFAHRPDIIDSISRKLRQLQEGSLLDSEDEPVLLSDVDEISVYCKTVDPTLQGYSLSDVFSEVLARISAADSPAPSTDILP